MFTPFQLLLWGLFAFLKMAIWFHFSENGSNNDCRSVINYWGNFWFMKVLLIKKIQWQVIWQVKKIVCVSRCKSWDSFLKTKWMIILELLLIRANNFSWVKADHPLPCRYYPCHGMLMINNTEIITNRIKFTFVFPQFLF